MQGALLVEKKKIKNFRSSPFPEQKKKKEKFYATPRTARRKLIIFKNSAFFFFLFGGKRPSYIYYIGVCCFVTQYI